MSQWVKLLGLAGKRQAEPDVRELAPAAAKQRAGEG